MANLKKLTGLLAAVAIACLAMVACASDNPESTQATFDIGIVDRALFSGPETIKVNQNDEVTINISADEQTEFHLHGYDLTASASPGGKGKLTFTANATGRFPFAVHVSGESADGGHGEHGGHSHSHTAQIEAANHMSVSLTARPYPDGGYLLAIDTEGFEFAPELAGMAHVDGVGHGHVYVDGVKQGRIYGDYFHLDELEPGERVIRVSLNANTHEEYTSQGHPVSDTVTVTAPGEPTGASHDHSHDHGDRDDAHAEIELGWLEVAPN